MTPILELDQIEVRFGGLKAVDEVSLSVREGEIFSVIGPNGAGKTTLFNAVAAFVPLAGGKVSFHGGRIDGLPQHRIVALGVARTWQNVRIFPAFTVLQNIMSGRIVRTTTGLFASVLNSKVARREEREAEQRARELIRFVGLDGRESVVARHLAYGEQKAVEIARALATEPALVLLDEPAAGLNASETERLMALVRRIRDTGRTVLLIEHDMRMVMGISERIAVLDHGRKIAEGTPSQVKADRAVIASYLGEEEPDAAPAG
ncbi:MAG: ABC transporter ATP-binding protein [Spirochaetales bacterium]|nr:ABC transporter ATP-binding protein [Spirochaetales bacterium]